MSNKIDRRSFLKIMGWGGVGASLTACDVPTTVTLEEGKEEVVSYLVPEEYMTPGIGVWYSSTCQQCSAGCGIHGRVREGRVLKLEGNPDSVVNNGKLCQMGQAGVQTHYNPDRITQPMVRKNGSLSNVSWDEAMGLLDEKLGTVSGLKSGRAAWVTGAVSGHQAVLFDALAKSTGGKSHYVTEVIHNGIWQQVCKDMLGDARPSIHLDKAAAILSFGADFLGTWASPVHFAGSYAQFRSAPRGTLMQIEPKMTLTGANADLWAAIKPGTEGILALGIANHLVSKHHVKVSNLPSSARNLIKSYGLNEVSRITGVAGHRIVKIAATLKERSPSLVLAGASAEGHENGHETVAAIMLLNVILGNIGQTITGSQFPFKQLTGKDGSTRDMMSFLSNADDDQYDVAVFCGANPVFHAPAALNTAEKLAKIPFKVALSLFEDETTAQADLILPLRSSLESWGTHVPSTASVISLQQPLMEPIFEQTRDLGDLLLSILQLREAKGYSGFPDYYAYLQNEIKSLPAASLEGGLGDDVWAKVLQKGVLAVKSKTTKLKTHVAAVKAIRVNKDDASPYHLVPSARLGLWDGRHANIPWLQEAPDQISKVVWDSWAEVHPDTAAKLGVKEGDAIKIASAHGAIEAKVYIYKGIHREAISVPMGQGHEGYGRYATGRGVNPLSILNPVTDKKTGELALFATRVSATKVGAKDILVRFGGSETQVGRKLVATVKSNVFNRTEGGA